MYATRNALIAVAKRKQELAIKRVSEWDQGFFRFDRDRSTPAPNSALTSSVCSQGSSGSGMSTGTLILRGSKAFAFTFRELGMIPNDD